MRPGRVLCLFLDLCAQEHTHRAHAWHKLVLKLARACWFLGLLLLILALASMCFVNPHRRAGPKDAVILTRVRRCGCTE